MRNYDYQTDEIKRPLLSMDGDFYQTWYIDVLTSGEYLISLEDEPKGVIERLPEAIEYVNSKIHSDV